MHFTHKGVFDWLAFCAAVIFLFIFGAAQLSGVAGVEMAEKLGFEKKKKDPGLGGTGWNAAFL